MCPGFTPFVPYVTNPHPVTAFFNMVALHSTLVMIPWRTVRIKVEKAFQPPCSESRQSSLARYSLITDGRMGCTGSNCNLDGGRVQKAHEMVNEHALCVCCLETKPIFKRCRITGCVIYVIDVGHLLPALSKFKQRTKNEDCSMVESPYRHSPQKKSQVDPGVQGSQRRGIYFCQGSCLLCEGR